MNGSGFAPSRVYWAAGLALATAFALIWTTAAHAQQSAGDQYAVLTAASGPAAGLSCSMIQANGDGLLDEGDTVMFPGDFSVASGASVVIDDADGTQGTLIDGDNAQISEGDGSIEIALTGDPINVAGGDGVLSEKVCNSIVATTGVSAAQSDDEGAVALVLPNTGGAMLVLYFGAIAVAGLLLFGRRALLRR